MSCCGEPRVVAPQQGMMQEKSGMMGQNNGFPQGQQQQQQPQAQPPMGMFTPPQGPQSPPQAVISVQPFGVNGPTSPNTMNGEFGQQQQQQQQQFGGGPNSWNNTPTINGNSAGSSYTPLLDPNIVRPNPVHASDAASQHPASIRSSAFSPGPQILSPQFTGTTMGLANNNMYPPPNNPGYQVSMQQISSQANQGPTVAAPSDEGRMSVSIDFGTTFSGVSYGSSRIASGIVQQILVWPGASENFRKIPTCLLYDETGRVIAWGLEAKNASPTPGTIRCEWCVKKYFRVASIF